MTKTELLYEVLLPYKVEGRYCEVCHNTDGEQKYLIDDVTLCDVCLVEGKRWEWFGEIVDLLEQSEARERRREKYGG